jgi:phosphomannomutase
VQKDIFRAYDIRGFYPDEVNTGLVRDVVRCLKEKFFKKGKVIIGRDTRRGSVELCREAINEIEGNGFNAIEAGVITTPMLTFLVNDLGASGGVMITASHNPKEYNGLKVVKEGGVPIGGDAIYKELVSNE